MLKTLEYVTLKTLSVNHRLFKYYLSQAHHVATAGTGQGVVRLGMVWWGKAWQGLTLIIKSFEKVKNRNNKVQPSSNKFPASS